MGGKWSKDRRDSQIQIRIDEKNYQELMKRAKEQGLSLSAYIRHQLFITENLQAVDSKKRTTENGQQEESGEKRKRGRPRKVETPKTNQSEPPKKRGRPRKE